MKIEIDNNTLCKIITENPEFDKKLIVPDSVKIITSCLDQDIEEIILPDSVFEIESGAFWFCISLKTIKVSDKLRFIGNNAFQYCRNLKSIHLPNGLVRIYDSAFIDCKSLESINIPSSIQSFGRNAFEGTPWLKKRR